MTATPLAAPERLLTIPNLLTGARLVAVPFFLAEAARGSFRTAFIVFVAAAVTDVVDGFVARRLNQRSRLGALLDPAADKIMMICGYLYFTFSLHVALRIPQWLTLIVFLRDFLIMVFAYLLFRRFGVTRFPPSRAGKASTVVQACALGAAIAVSAFGPGFRLIASILFPLALLVTLLSSGIYLRRAFLRLRAGR